jgi:hypothetical protein
MEFDATGDMTAWVGIAYTAIAAIAGWIYRWGAGLRDANEKLSEKQAADKAEFQAKLQALELKLAVSYHDKSEFREILDRSLEPILDMLKDIKDWMKARDNGNGASNGRHP